MDLIFLKPWSYLFALWIWVSDRWDIIGAAASLATYVPVALLSSGSDQFIPSHMQRQVYDAFRTTLKVFLSTPEARHQDIDLEAFDQQQGLQKWLKVSCARLSNGC